MIFAMNTQTLEVKQNAPIPLESLAPLPQQNSAKEWEKGQYWNSLLSGELDKVPFALRRKAGAEDESLPPAERDYRLMSSINRSWVVDHQQMNREQVRANWPELRRNMAQQLQVRDSEQEVYSGLSLRHQEKPRRDEVRQRYTQHYTAALAGKPVSEEQQGRDEVAFAAREDALAAREAYLPLAEQVANGWSAIKAQETQFFSLPDVALNTPDLFRAVNALADMPLAERAKVYKLAQSLAHMQEASDGRENLGEAMLHSVRRGVSDIGHSALQGMGHVATALTRSAAETLDSDPLRKASTAADKRLQVLHELRRVGQDEVFPIDLGEECSFWEELAVDAAGAVPSAALAFMGGGGFGMLTLASTGAAVAEARRRAPEGRQELQTAAGVVGGAMQAGIYMGMSRIGAHMLNRSIREFVKARHGGVGEYSLAALKSLGSLTAENAKLLLAGKLAQAGELGMQELAARVDKVASNIDWESFGNNITDIETNMREAAMNLPFILIAAGRAALHHFRNPGQILESGDMLASWGIDEATRKRLLEEPDVYRQNDMLMRLLRSSKRWSGGGALEEFARSLRLLNTPEQLAFRSTDEVRAFLDFSGKNEFAAHSRVTPPDVSDPAVALQVAERITGRKTPPLNMKQRMPYLLLMDEWNQKSQGRFTHSPEERKARGLQYVDMVREPERVLTRDVKLDGYYIPQRVEMLNTLCADMVREAQDLSYLSLLNIETLDSLARSYTNVDIAREKGEQHRKRILSELCRAVHRCFTTGSPSFAFDEMRDALCDIYLKRRKNARNAPDWLRKASPRDFAQAMERMEMREMRPSLAENPKLRELRHIALGLRACGEVLYHLLPHTDQYQDALSIGYNPVEAAQFTLQHLFRGELQPEIWPRHVADAIRPNDADNRIRFQQSRDALLHYMELSGVRPESSPDGSGKLLWRLKRPDGRYTPWLPTKEMAGNAVAGNVQTLFLPMGGDALLSNIRNALRRDPSGKIYFWRHHMYKEEKRKMLGFDHLGNAASRDLCALWLGSSTLYNVGLEIAADKKGWERHKGTKLDKDLKLWDADTNHYLAKYQKVLTPLRLANLRFRAYWNRMLSSGWVDSRAVADALLESKLVGSHEMADIMALGQDYEPDFKKMTRERRTMLRRGLIDRVRKGDVIAMNAALARHMARLNTVYMMHNMRHLNLPDSVKQWFYSSLFSEYKMEADELKPRNPLAVYANRKTAEEAKSLIPLMNKMRQRYARKEDYPLQQFLQEAIEPGEPMRLENGWCYSIGGDSAFRTSGQHVWNLLRDPERAWKLLGENDRELVAQEIKEVCGGREPEDALRELGEVLQQYPELRAYHVDAREPSGISCMVLAPIKTRDLVEPVYTVYENTRLFRPWGVKKDYQVETNASLPEHCRQDARVMPALRLLAELRRLVTSTPYTNEQGIWWKGERYGGLTGRRPQGVGEDWSPELPLKPMLEFFGATHRMAQQQGSNGRLKVCGVELGGLCPEDLDAGRLQHITIYRNPMFPEHTLRLMPGEVNAASPFQRAPYVVHTADGLPLLPTRQAKTNIEIIQSFMPLAHFNSKLDRAYDYEYLSKKRNRQVNSHLDMLLNDRAKSPRHWMETDETGINNLELFMQLFQDCRLPDFLNGKNPAELTRGEALTCELARLMLLAECGNDRMSTVGELVEFCNKLRQSEHDVALVKAVLARVVSPFPNEYAPIELAEPGPESAPDSPDDYVERD